MNVSQKGIDIIKNYEKCRLTAYLCPANVWTIGYGHTAGVTKGMVITQAKADQFLLEDLKKCENNVNSFHAKYNFNQNEFDALISFAFNLGSINQLTANGTRTKQVIGEKITLYNKAGGVVLNGLVKRRAEEQALYFNKVVTNNTSANSTTQRATVKLNSKGAAVTELQTLLKKKGYTITIDGIFGRKTYEIVKCYQAENDLIVDGIVGAKTWAKLLAN